MIGPAFSVLLGNPGSEFGSFNKKTNKGWMETFD